MAGTPGEEEMKAIRQEKLNTLITELLHETDRLGYIREEVRRVFADRIGRGNS